VEHEQKSRKRVAVNSGLLILSGHPLAPLKSNPISPDKGERVYFYPVMSGKTTLHGMAAVIL
jgi:hypothetical protein